VIVVMAALTRSDRCASDEKLPTLLELASLVVEIDGRVAELERGQRMAAAQRSAVEAARTRTDPYEIVDAAARALRVGLSLDRDPASGDARVRWTGTGERPDDADLEMLAAVVSIAIARDRAAFEVEERLSYGLVRALLTGDAARASELEDRARLLGIDLREPRAVVTLRTNGLLSRRLLERITREAPQEGLVTVQDDVVVVLWPAERASDLATLRGEVEQMLRRIAPGSLWAGVGRVCRASSDYAVSSRESLFAMHTARQSPDLRHVIDADELGMYRLAAQVVASESAREAVVDALGPLIKIDEKSTSQLLPTLRAYLEHDRRIAETARVLHIHPNTLRYRIDQINQLLDVDFDDPDCRFHLILALRLAVITGVADMAGAAISAQIAEVARAELGGSAQLASRSS
jgi:sugar diacid utilization regulator